MTISNVRETKPACRTQHVEIDPANDEFNITDEDDKIKRCK